MSVWPLTTVEILGESGMFLSLCFFMLMVIVIPDQATSFDSFQNNGFVPEGLTHGHNVSCHSSGGGDDDDDTQQNCLF